MPHDILNLPHWTVVATREDGNQLDIDATYDMDPTLCLRCGVVGASLYGHGPRTVSYRDSPIRTHTVSLVANLKRYKCRECGGTFLQPVSGVREDMRMTNRCAEHIAKEALNRPFTHVASLFGCDEKTVRTLAAARVEVIDDGYQPLLPVWLGIDETTIEGKLRLVLTDLSRRAAIEMLPDRSKTTLATWLGHYQDRSPVKAVSIDMYRPYRDVVNEMLPGVPVVIDKFHVVRMANYCMERTRIRKGKTQAPGVRREWMRSKAILNKRLKTLTVQQRFAFDMWMDNDPEMAASHKLKEAFFAIYDMPKAEAVAAYDGFKDTVPAYLKADWKIALTAMKNWRTEILAYFDLPITNAYTESLNRTAKDISRMGRGYSFEVLRARLLFGKVGLRWAALHPHQSLGVPRTNLTNCRSCGRLFDKRALSLGMMLPVFKGERKQAALICKDCHGRFHSD